MTIEQLQTRLANLNTALDDAIGTGMKVQIPGSFSAENYSFKDIQNLISITRKQILRRQGYQTRRTQPDFS